MWLLLEMAQAERVEGQPCAEPRAQSCLRKFRLILWTELPLEATLLCLCQAAQGLLLSGDLSGSSCLSPGAEALDGCYPTACVPGRHSDLDLGNDLSPRSGLFPRVAVRALASGSQGRPFISFTSIDQGKPNFWIWEPIYSWWLVFGG